jgi:hypothetical protein
VKRVRLAQDAKKWEDSEEMCFILLDKLIVVRLVKEFLSHFMVAEGSLPCSQQPAIDPYR